MYSGLVCFGIMKPLRLAWTTNTFPYYYVYPLCVKELSRSFFIDSSGVQKVCDFCVIGGFLGKYVLETTFCDVTTKSVLHGGLIRVKEVPKQEHTWFIFSDAHVFYVVCDAL